MTIINMKNKFIVALIVIYNFLNVPVSAQNAKIWMGTLMAGSEQCQAAVTETTANTDKMLMIDYASGALLGQLQIMANLLSKSDEELAAGDIPESGEFLLSHPKSYGDADACKSITNMKYCWGKVGEKELKQAAPTVGICIPKQCNSHDIQAGLNLMASMGGDPTAKIPVNFQCGEQIYEKTLGTYIIWGIGGFVSVCILLGTLIEGFSKNKILQEDKESESLALSTDLSSTSYVNVSTTSPQNGMNQQEEKQSEPEEIAQAETLTLNNNNVTVRQAKQGNIKESRLISFFKCFSLYTNIRLLNSKPKGDFQCLSGIRVFSMAWVIMGHILIFQLMALGYTNVTELVAPTGLLGTIFGQVFYGYFAVDTFFFLGAFLATYMLITHFTKKNCNKVSCGMWIPKLILHRFIRLTPAYMATLFIFMKAFKNFDHGPFWDNDSNDRIEVCERTWIFNFLYIQNFLNFKDQCYTVSWYMANDMQLFLLVPIFVMFYLRSKVLGYSAATLLIIANGLWTQRMAFINKWTFDMFSPNFMEFFEDNYVKPWARGGVYLVGVIFAFLWHDSTFQKNTNTFKDLLNGCKRNFYYPLLWSLTAATLVFVIWGYYPVYSGMGLSNTLNALFVGWARTIWAVGLGLLSFLLFVGEGGPIKSLLEMDIMHPLGKLTYGCYLLHPMVLDWWQLNGDNRQATHFNLFSFFVNWIGVTSITFIFAAILHFTVERPLMNIERLMKSKPKEVPSLPSKSTEVKKILDKEMNINASIEEGASLENCHVIKL